MQDSGDSSDGAPWPYNEDTPAKRRVEAGALRQHAQAWYGGGVQGGTTVVVKADRRDGGGAPAKAREKY